MHKLDALLAKGLEEEVNKGAQSEMVPSVNSSSTQANDWYSDT